MPAFAQTARPRDRLRIEALVGGRALFGEPRALELRFGLGVSVWPRALRQRLGFALAVAAGPGISVDGESFAGHHTDVALALGARSRLHAGARVAFEPRLGVAAHFTTLDGGLPRRARRRAALHRGGAVMRLVVWALLVAGCGREDVELLPRDGGAGDLPPGCMAPDGPRRCLGLGAACTVPTECCSNRCAGGVCLEPGACLGGGATCTDRGQCCSGRCEPVPGAPGRVCLDDCRPDGASCTSPHQCCGLACRAGTCGGALCAEVGDDCTVGADCCSGLCDGERCALNALAGCRPTGEDCSSSGGEPCCSGACASSGRCDYGPGPCRAAGAPCETSADCCRGTCEPGAGGVRICVAACLPDGAACTQPSDCCAGGCAGQPAVCGPPQPACRLLGQSCVADEDCCSALCVGGTCGTMCPIM